MIKKSKNVTQKDPPATRVLALLARAGGWCSGEEVAARLGVSRAAVAKHIVVLRKAGHVIRSRTHKGYWLEIPAETMDTKRINAALATRCFGRSGWRVLDNTASTNNEAIAWALSGGPEGAVVTAETQTDGKGRKGHDWFSSSHGLAASLLLRPRRKPATDDAVTRCALEAMQEAIQTTAQVAATIKNPNDLVVNGKKLCGVLVEAGWRGDEPDWLVLGVGCNVSVPEDEFPEPLRQRVTSLYIASGKVVSKNLLLAHFLNQLEKKLNPV